MKSRRISPTKKYINARDLELDLLLNLAIFGRLFLGMSGITCKTCNTLKANDCFRIKKDGIGYYDNCLDCWRGEATEFWKTKSFRVCGSCDEKLPLRLFATDKYDIPFKSCTPCHEKIVAEKYRKLRKAAARVSTVSGVETSNAKCSVSSTNQNSKPG